MEDHIDTTSNTKHSKTLAVLLNKDKAIKRKKIKNNNNQYK